jgi:hypothetical protein
VQEVQKPSLIALLLDFLGWMGYYGPSVMGVITFSAFGSNDRSFEGCGQNIKNAATRRSPIGTNLEKSAAEWKS